MYIYLSLYLRDSTLLVKWQLNTLDSQGIKNTTLENIRGFDFIENVRIPVVLFGYIHKIYFSD